MKNKMSKEIRLWLKSIRDVKAEPHKCLCCPNGSCFGTSRENYCFVIEGK